MANNKTDDTTKETTERTITAKTGNTITGSQKERTQRTTATGVVIRNVTKSGAGIGIVGGVEPQNKKTN
jgi:hypothetical protein